MSKGKIKFLLLIAAVALGGFLLARVYMSATSPSSVKVVVYKVELMTGASDANPQVVFSSDAGQEVDFTKDVDAVVGQARMPAGSYNRLRMTVANGIKLSIADADDNPCGDGTIFTDRVFPIAEGTNVDSRVQVDFATGDDGGGTWAGPRIVHLLLRPVTVSGDQPTQVKFKFNTADTLFCSGGTVQRLAPWSVFARAL